MCTSARAGGTSDGLEYIGHGCRQAPPSGVNRTVYGGASRLARSEGRRVRVVRVRARVRTAYATAVSLDRPGGSNVQSFTGHRAAHTTSHSAMHGPFAIVLVLLRHHNIYANNKMRSMSMCNIAYRAPISHSAKSGEASGIAHARSTTVPLAWRSVEPRHVRSRVAQLARSWRRPQRSLHDPTLPSEHAVGVR